MELEFQQIEMRHADLRIFDEGRRRRLLSSLAEAGQQVPVVVICESSDRYVLIDGYLRVDALKRLSHDTVSATNWTLAEPEALLHHHHISLSSRSALEEAWLLGRLRERGLGLDELARRLCRSKSWVSRRLALVSELPEAVQACVRAGTIPPHAAQKYLVPLARANRCDCEGLVRALSRTHVSVREVAALYEGWRRADKTGRQRLVEDPRLYLRAVLCRKDKQGDDAHGALAKDLTTLSAVAWRARQRIATNGFAKDLSSVWRAAKNAFDALETAVCEGSHAGRSQSDEHSQAT